MRTELTAPSPTQTWALNDDRSGGGGGGGAAARKPVVPLVVKPNDVDLSLAGVGLALLATTTTQLAKRAATGSGSGGAGAGTDASGVGVCSQVCGARGALPPPERTALLCSGGGWRRRCAGARWLPGSVPLPWGARVCGVARTRWPVLLCGCLVWTWW